MSESIAPRRRPNGLLIVSLCLNAALIGVVGVNIAMAMHREFRPVVGDGPLAPHELIRMAPAESAKIRNIIDAHRERIAALKAQAMRSRKEAFAVFASPDFNSEKFVQAVAAVHEADDAWGRESVKAVSESVAVLTPQERQDIAQRIQRRNGSWWRRVFGLCP
jgi:Spy/CpxP family protein refolding chaperone